MSASHDHARTGNERLLWITTGKPTLTARLLHDAGMDTDALLNPLKQVLESEFAIHHTTLQLETRACRQGLEGENCSAPEPLGESRQAHA